MIWVWVKACYIIGAALGALVTLVATVTVDSLYLAYAVAGTLVGFGVAAWVKKDE